MYDSLYGLATRSTHPQLTQRTVKTGTSIYQPRPTSATRNDRPSAFNDSTDLSFPQRSSSCIQRLDRPSFPQRSSSCIQRLDRPQLPATIVQLHSTTRPTPASSNDRPATCNNSTDLSFPQRSSSCHRLYTRARKHGNKLSSLLNLLPRLCFLHCLWLSLLARFKLKHLRHRRAYRVCNNLYR